MMNMFSGQVRASCLLSALCLLLVLQAAAQKKGGKRIYLSKRGDNGVLLKASSIAYNPGDTLVLRASEGPFSYVYLGEFSGTEKQPLVVINEGGQVELLAGFDIESCQYLKVTGSGSKDKFGFVVRQSKGVALGIHKKSAHVEAERFLVEGAAFGCWIKNEASCDTSINNWVLDDIRVHDYEMRGIKIEGFYMGSTDPNNSSRPVTCNGEKKYYRPSKLGNIKVYNGLIDGTGRPAIMLCNAAVGMSEIYNNTVLHAGREYSDQQGSGIALGMYTRAYVHHNTVRNTYTWGIVSLGGSGLIRIENNTVDSSGYLDGRTVPWAQNIMIDTRRTAPVDSTRFIIRRNKVSHPGSQAASIYVGKTVNSYAKGNTICNNSKGAKIYVEDGIDWKLCNVTQKPVPGSNTKTLLIGPLALCLFSFLYFLLKRKMPPVLR